MTCFLTNFSQDICIILFTIQSSFRLKISLEPIQKKDSNSELTGIIFTGN